MSTRRCALWLGGGMILLYIFQLLLPGITDNLVFIAAEFLQRPWGIISSIFIHSPSDYMHLLNNMFFLLIFGTILEHYIGSRDFLGVFFATGIVANLAAFTFYPTTPTLGASGAVSGIVAALAVLKPRKIGLFWGVPLPMWLVLVGWILTNLAGVGADAGIAYEAHLYGLFSGAAAGLYYRKKYRPGKDSEREELEVGTEQIRRWEKKYMEG